MKMLDTKHNYQKDGCYTVEKTRDSNLLERHSWKCLPFLEIDTVLENTFLGANVPNYLLATVTNTTRSQSESVHRQLKVL